VLGFAELVGELGLDVAESFAAVHYEQDKIRSLHGDVCLKGDLIQEAIIELSSDSSSIYDSAGCFRHSAWRSDAVTSDSWLIVNDGDSPVSEAIKDGGLAHIWASYDGDVDHDDD
jgi:hypothetical protein|tara:strand:- start:23099 stop:23443 length:345 start_codon:yes stop_codon:yes gene_type:complete